MAERGMRNVLTLILLLSTLYAMLTPIYAGDPYFLYIDTYYRGKDGESFGIKDWPVEFANYYDGRIYVVAPILTDRTRLHDVFVGQLREDSAPYGEYLWSRTWGTTFEEVEEIPYDAAIDLVSKRIWVVGEFGDSRATYAMLMSIDMSKGDLMCYKVFPVLPPDASEKPKFYRAEYVFLVKDLVYIAGVAYNNEGESPSWLFLAIFDSECNFVKAWTARTDGITFAQGDADTNNLYFWLAGTVGGPQYIPSQNNFPTAINCPIPDPSFSEFDCTAYIFYIDKMSGVFYDAHLGFEQNSVILVGLAGDDGGIYPLYTYYDPNMNPIVTVSSINGRFYTLYAKNEKEILAGGLIEKNGYDGLLMKFDLKGEFIHYCMGYRSEGTYIELISHIASQSEIDSKIIFAGLTEGKPMRDNYTISVKNEVKSPELKKIPLKFSEAETEPKEPPYTDAEIHYTYRWSLGVQGLWVGEASDSPPVGGVIIYNPLIHPKAVFQLLQLATTIMIVGASYIVYKKLRGKR